jgi:hypothetical protein
MRPMMERIFSKADAIDLPEYESPKSATAIPARELLNLAPSESWSRHSVTATHRAPVRNATIDASPKVLLDLFERNERGQRGAAGQRSRWSYPDERLGWDA